VNGIVYFATLKERTYALDARTGKRLWRYPDGQYTPVVADVDRLYLVGHAKLYGMVEQ
jgi:glucose dehydrogenase